jgi:uncharacterized protein
VSHALDVNVLLYAVDAASPLHARARRLVEALALGTETLCLAWPTVMGFLRMATHPGILARPLAPDDAMANVEALAGRPHVRFLGEAEGFLEAYRDLTRGLAVRGNLVPDAHVATILTQHGVRTLYTNDADFKKFPGLVVKNPFA